MDLCVLAGFGGHLLQKVKGENADYCSGLREAVYLIVQALESPAARQAKDPLPHWWQGSHLQRVSFERILRYSGPPSRTSAWQMMPGYFTASSSVTNWSYTALWPNASMSRQATAAGRINGGSDIDDSTKLKFPTAGASACTPGS
jgi:hypothetical protein